jgi:hypothetical protein
MKYSGTRKAIAGVILGLVLSVLPVAALAQNGERCFSETGFCISGRIREFWEGNGGLPVFGFPITPQQEEQIEGRPFQVQWFERNRLELHPENQRPYDVLLGRLGADRLAQLGRDPFTFPKSEQQPNCRFFPETGHNACGDILAAWRANGLEIDGRGGKTEAENLALFGLPLSDLMTETLSDGKQYQVQWFERARFELHPENAPPYNVLLGLLGNEVRANAAPPAPPAPPEPLAPSFNNCQEDPNWTKAPNYPIQIVNVNKQAETVSLKNVSPDPISLDGWRMCSIRGNQQHTVFGPIAPGETRLFLGPEGNIWSNSETDQGALYDPEGRLVAYWPD